MSKSSGWSFAACAITMHSSQTASSRPQQLLMQLPCNLQILQTVNSSDTSAGTKETSALSMAIKGFDSGATSRTLRFLPVLWLNCKPVCPLTSPSGLSALAIQRPNRAAAL